MIRAEISAYDLPGDAKIERCQQRDGSYKWAVRCRGLCMDHDGEFEWEPMPSNRDDAFFARCRFRSAEEAYETWVLTQTANASLSGGRRPSA